MNSYSFTHQEWQLAVKKADEKMKESKGHQFMTILKTRCEHCGKKPTVKTKCPAWCNTLVNNIFFYIANKDTEMKSKVSA